MSAVPWQHRLVATSIHLAKEAGKVIRAVQQKGFQACNKAEGSDGMLRGDLEAMAGADFLTEADTSAQACMVTGYREAFPWLRIVAEEDDQPDQLPPVNPPDVSDVAVSGLCGEVAKLMLPGQQWETWKQDDMCVWIDPVDGTKEFVLGRTSAVCPPTMASMEGVFDGRLSQLHDTSRHHLQSRGRRGHRP